MDLIARLESNRVEIRRLKREVRINAELDRQATIARLVRRQLDCGVDARERALLREQRVLKLIVAEMGASE